MKQFKVLLIFFVTVFIVFIIGVVVFLKTVDVNRFKGQITSQMSKSIGRVVTLEHVTFRFSLGQGVVLNISGLTIMDHPDFSSDPAFYIDSCHLNIDILPFLSKRQILISKVQLDSLTVHLIRNSDGEFNFEKFAQKSSETTGDQPGSPEGRPAQQTKTKPKKSKEIAFGDMLIRSILVSDGKFVFTDRAVTPAVTISITQLEIRITNVAPDTPFPFTVMASLWSAQKNIQIDGLAQFNMKNRQVRIDDLKIKSDLSQLALDRLYEGIPSFKQAGLQSPLGGQMTLTVLQMVLGEKGLLVMSSEGRLIDGALGIKDSPVAITNLNMHFEVSESDLKIKNITLPLASGEIHMSGTILDYLKEQKFAGDINIKDVRLSGLTKDMDLPAKIEGKLYGNLKGNGVGLDEKALKTSLVGEGAMEVKEGRILDINILKLVLSKLSFLPNLGEQIEESLPDKYKEKLKQNDTILEKVAIDTRIQNGALVINRAELNADGFVIIGRGKLDFDQNLSAQAEFFMPDDLTKSLVAKSQELSYFLNEDGRIQIPFTPYNGKLANFRMLPDVGDLGKRVIQNKGKEELKKVIFKALELEDKQPSRPAPEGGKATPQEREVRPEEVIIENILDTIFK